MTKVRLIAAIIGFFFAVNAGAFAENRTCYAGTGKGYEVKQVPCEKVKHYEYSTYDGCNTTTCDENGLCSSTLRYCRPENPNDNLSDEELKEKYPGIKIWYENE